MQDLCVTHHPIQAAFLGLIRVRINDSQTLGSWRIKGTDDSLLRVNSSISLRYHEPEFPLAVCQSDYFWNVVLKLSFISLGASIISNYNFPDISLRPTQLLFDMFVKHIKSFTNNVLLISISRQSSVWLAGSIKNRKSAAKSKIYKQTPFTLYFSHVAMVHSVSSWASCWLDCAYFESLFFGEPQHQPNLSVVCEEFLFCVFGASSIINYNYRNPEKNEIFTEQHKTCCN